MGAPKMNGSVPASIGPVCVCVALGELLAPDTGRLERLATSSLT
jgi:hypothetical protein